MWLCCVSDASLVPHLQALQHPRMCKEDILHMLLKRTHATLCNTPLWKWNASKLWGRHAILAQQKWWLISSLYFRFFYIVVKIFSRRWLFKSFYMERKEKLTLTWRHLDDSATKNSEKSDSLMEQQMHLAASFHSHVAIAYTTSHSTSNVSVKSLRYSNIIHNLTCRQADSG